MTLTVMIALVRVSSLLAALRLWYIKRLSREDLLILGLGTLHMSQSQSKWFEKVAVTDVAVLEAVQAGKFTAVSVGQWFALTPIHIIEDTVGSSDNVLDSLQQYDKSIVIQGSPDLTTTHFIGDD